MLARAPIAVLATLLLLAAGSAGAEPGAASGQASARAYAVKVLVAGAGGGTPEAVAPPDAARYGGGFAYPADGSVVAVHGGDAARLQDVRVLDGALTARTIEIGEPTAVTGLAVSGSVVAASDNLVEPIPGGWAMVQQHAVVPGKDGGPGRETG
ncbi:MAG: hypothetical protein H0V40_08215, partial [Actinobacteria bacterium]|nr:hypothetical protein [Actinomycetota bacterium]